MTASRHVSNRLKPTTFSLRLLPAIAAALALLARAPAHAMGDATDAELPWVRPGDTVALHGTAAPAATSAAPTTAASAAPTDAAPSPTLSQGAVTRADVAASLDAWRAAGLLTPQGDIGDSTEVLERREMFYALQTEVLQEESLAAARAAEEAQALAELLAQGADIAMLQPSADGQVRTSPDGVRTEIVEIDD